jgi:hypothetical protein
MFMLVVTFVVASTTGFAFTDVADGVPSESPVVAFDVQSTDDGLVVRHEHGEKVAVNTLELVVHRPAGVDRIPFADFAADDQSTLTAGESVVRNEGVPPDTIELRIVYDRETVLYKGSVDG